MTTTDPYTYWAPTGGHPPQSDLLTDRALVTEAYTVIPRGVLRDIVTSNLPEWTGTRSWVLSKPVAGGAVTFSQTILEVAPGGGSEAPEPQPEVEGFLFVMAGQLDITHEGRNHTLTPGGFAFLPAGSTWSAKSTGTEAARLHWVRKRYQPVAGLVPEVQFDNEYEIEPYPVPGTDGRWRSTRPLDTAHLPSDTHVNIDTFEAETVISLAETHEMEHVLYVLEGNAVYLLHGDWVEVHEGNFILMRA